MRSELVGDYQLLDYIGAGTLGDVFLARKRGAHGFERLVALKRFHRPFVRDGRLAPPLVESAKAGAKLSHSAIAATLELGKAGDSYFLVREYVPGIELHALLRYRRSIGAAPFTAEAAYIVRRICDALVHAHLPDETSARGRLVHGALRPHHVLVSFDGSVRLIDFGMRSDAQPGGGLRDDIRAAGILLHELMVGRHPAAGRPRDKLPSGVGALLARAATTGPARFASAEDLQRALQRFVPIDEGSVQADLSLLLERVFAREIEKERARMVRVRKLPPPLPPEALARAPRTRHLSARSEPACLAQARPGFEPVSAVVGAGIPFTTLVSRRRRRHTRLALLASTLVAGVSVAAATLDPARLGERSPASGVTWQAAPVVAAAPEPAVTGAPPAKEAAAKPMPPQQAAKPPPARRAPRKRVGARRRRSAPPLLPRSRLHIDADGGPALVFLDGRNTGRVTPLEIPVEPGRHRVTIHRNDLAAPHQVDLHVPAGSEVRVRLRLVADPRASRRRGSVP